MMALVGLLVAACTEAAAPAPSVFTWSPFPRTAPPASAKPATAARPAPSAKPGAPKKPTTKPAAKPTTGPSSTAKPDTDGNRVVVKEARFSIEVPPGYLGLTNGNAGPSAAELAAITKKSGATEAEIRQMLASVTASAKGAESVVAFDPTTFHKGLGKVVLMASVSSRYIGTSLENYERASLRQLEAIADIGVIKHDMVTLPAGEAVRFSFDAKPTFADGSTVQTRWLMYAVLANGRQYLLLLVAPRADYASRHPIFMAMVRSLEIL